MQPVGSDRISAKDNSGAYDLPTRLAAHLNREIEMLEGLRDALIEQRGMIAANDVAAIDANAGSISRIIFSIERARAVRQEILSDFPGEPIETLDDLEKIVSDPLPVALGSARLELRRNAESVEREAAINRRVLERVLQIGDTLLQTLFTAVSGPAETYGPIAGPEPAVQGPGLLTNKVV